MEAKWTVRGDRLCLCIVYQQKSAISDNVSPVTANWQVPITTLADTAEHIIDNVKKTFNWKEVTGLNDWIKLL